MRGLVAGFAVLSGVLLGQPAGAQQPQAPPPLALKCQFTDAVPSAGNLHPEASFDRAILDLSVPSLTFQESRPAGRGEPKSFAWSHERFQGEPFFYRGTPRGFLLAGVVLESTVSFNYNEAQQELIFSYASPTLVIAYRYICSPE